VKRNKGLKKATTWLPEVTSHCETSAILHWMKLWRLIMLSHSSSSELVSRPYVLQTILVTLTEWTDCSTNLLTSNFCKIGCTPLVAFTLCRHPDGSFHRSSHDSIHCQCYKFSCTVKRVSTMVTICTTCFNTRPFSFKHQTEVNTFICPDR
jgi:hypothetical protein